MSKKKSAADPFHERESRRYEQPIASREHIAAQVEAAGELDFRALVSALGVKGQESRGALKKRLGAMCRDRQLVLDDGLYRLPSRDQVIEAKVQAHPDGFGFALIEDDEDIFLSANEMRQVFHGDVVAVEIIGRSRKGQAEGRIVEVLEKNTRRLVGRLMKERREYYIRPDNPRINHLLRLLDKPARSIAVGDYVTAAVVDYPDRFHEPTALIEEHLGSPLAPGLEIEMAIRSFELPHEWPAKVLDEAGRFASEPDDADKQKRVDLRDLPLVTIDGADARDFDDAVYCKKIRGGYKLWVAIADVSHYVALNSALDEEALSRGTSVYFPGRVVPMLPETLSNGLCSLNPEVDRLCMVCELTLSTAGIVKGFEFYEGVMHSKARLTYREVAEVLGLLESEPKPSTVKRLQPVMGDLKNLYALYTAMRKQRVKRGAIDFESHETQIIFNAERKIEEIVPAERNEAHKIIEECMLRANEAAAEFLLAGSLQGMFRNHEGPKAEKLLSIKEYLAELKLALPVRGEVQPSDYQQLMQRIAERPDQHVIQTMLLRSMRQAVYATENKGHFGLAYEAYTHFTSPIRRYPDLLVHRAIKHVIRSRKQCDQVRRVKGAKTLAKASIYPYDAGAMLTLAEHCSMTERRAEEACRDVIAWLKCEFLQEHLGSEFSGVVSGVTSFGLFVELDDLYVEGLVHVTGLDRDYFQFDAVSHALIGEQTGQVYALGDPLTVRVARVDLDNRKVDLDLVAHNAPRTATYTSKKRLRHAAGQRSGQAAGDGRSRKSRDSKRSGSVKKSAKAKGRGAGKKRR